MSQFGNHTIIQASNVLTPEQELFAAHIAAGESYSAAALKAGLHPVTGTRWAHVPEIRARVAELVEEQKREDLGGIASRSWIETHLVMVVNRIEDGQSSSEQLEAYRVEITALMSLAKLKGLIVERKQMTRASIDLGRLGVNDLQGHLGEMLDSLEPGARAEIETRIKRAKRGRKAIDTTAQPVEPTE